MPSTTYYVREGDGFVPVTENCGDMVRSLTQGSYLLTVDPGNSTSIKKLDVEYSIFDATAEVLRDDLIKLLVFELDATPNPKPLTHEQLTAWENLKHSFGNQMCSLEHKSIQSVVDSFLSVIKSKCQSVYEHPVLKQEHNRFKTLLKIAETNKPS